MEISEIDKQITKEIHKDLAGQTVKMICPVCRNLTENCNNCDGKGEINISY